jgi:tetratricopeptide (TPR) repeat protein
LGSCYHYQGTDETNINLALDCFLKANKIKPRNSLANNLIGYFYMVKNKPNEAILYFRDAVNYDPNNVSFRLNLVK